MKKKGIGVLLSALLLVGSLAGCQSAAESAGGNDAQNTTAQSSQQAAGEAASGTQPGGSGGAASDLKVGFIYVGDETDQGYTTNFMSGAREMQKKLGLKDDQIIEKKNMPEGAECATALKELAEAGCNIIFTTSFGFEQYMEEVAPDYPNIQFCQATGFQGATDKLENTHDFFPQIFQARYLSGIIAGMKTKTNKIGFVAAMPFSEVVSGYTAFYLGAKSVNPKVQMEVMYTNSWNDAQKEAQLAQALIDDGCDVLGQHADSAATATTAESNKVWQIGYNTDMIDQAPNASITGARCDWGSYITYAVQCVIDGKQIPQDWTGGLKENAVLLTPYNDKLMPQGAADAVEKAKQEIEDGKLHVFDTKTFTVDGKEMSSYITEAGKEFISDGYFHEQDPEVGGSSPAFPVDWTIDGITVKK